MGATFEHRLADGRLARVRFTDRADGDLRVSADPADLAARRTALVDLPWTWLRQVHADRVVEVDRPGAAAGEEADAAVTRESGAVLAVHTADCGPVVLVADEGAVAVAHAGWKGLATGVLTATVERLDGPFRAYVGPLIGPECYEFGPDDLAALVDRLGPHIEGRTGDGRPALDLPAAIRHELDRLGAVGTVEVPGCTACETATRFSHRARQDEGRQAALVWIEDDR